MFDKLKELLGDNTEAISELSSISDNYSKLIERADKADNLVSNLKEEKSKMKSFIAATKTALNIEEGEELSSETVNSKFDTIKTKLKSTGSKKEQDLMDQIANYEKVVSTLKSEKEEVITTSKANELDRLLEIELLNSTQGIDTHNDDSAKVIRDLLKSGLSYEDGSSVYRNNEGSIVKGADGITNKSLSDTLDELKDNERYSYLFKSKKTPGTGTETADNGKGDIEDDSIEARMARRAAAK